VRGEPPADLAAAREVLLRVSQLVTDFPEIVEMDINPLVLLEEGKGAVAIDMRLVLDREAGDQATVASDREILAPVT
jgi:acetyltransferase